MCQSVASISFPQAAASSNSPVTRMEASYSFPTPFLLPFFHAPCERGVTVSTVNRGQSFQSVANFIPEEMFGWELSDLPGKGLAVTDRLYYFLGGVEALGKQLLTTVYLTCNLSNLTQV